MLNGQAPERLLDSYEDERGAAADEHVMVTTRSTDFITPKGSASKLFRNAALELSNPTRSRGGWSIAAGCHCRRSAAIHP